jgi:predicted lipoprotein with Yx(FWY)xxD motif
MSPERKLFRSRSRVSVAAAVAVVGVVALTGVALAKTFTLQEAKNATVSSQSKTIHENIVVNSAGRAVYWLSGDSKSHPECTKASGCFSIWPPVKVASTRSLSKGPGVSGTLGTWKRNGFIQVTLSGHPLYTYLGDTSKDKATGQGVKSFGGTWSVVKAATSSTGSSGSGW